MSLDLVKFEEINTVIASGSETERWNGGGWRCDRVQWRRQVFCCVVWLRINTQTKEFFQYRNDNVGNRLDPDCWSLASLKNLSKFIAIHHIYKLYDNNWMLLTFLIVLECHKWWKTTEDQEGTASEERSASEDGEKSASAASSSDESSSDEEDDEEKTTDPMLRNDVKAALGDAAVDSDGEVWQTSWLI